VDALSAEAANLKKKLEEEKAKLADMDSKWWEICATEYSSAATYMCFCVSVTQCQKKGK
jgi:hypothetical protein